MTKHEWQRGDKARAQSHFTGNWIKVVIRVHNGQGFGGAYCQGLYCNNIIKIGDLYGAGKDFHACLDCCEKI